MLRQAVTEGRTWDEVLTALGLKATGNKALLVPYDPEIIELFLIVDGDLAIYLIPSRVIGGRVQILLRTYRNFIVGNAAGLMRQQPPTA